jgi:hypothetical protein
MILILKKIDTILAPDGLVVINTPDTDSLYAKLLSKKWHSLIPPEHIMLYNKDNLRTLLEQNNFSVVYAGKLSKKFALQYIVSTLSNWWKMKSLVGLSDWLKHKSVGKLTIPLDLRDNFFIIARKNN